METDTLTWRALTVEDAPALARAHAAAEAADRTGENYSEQDFRDELTDEALDLSRDTLAAVAPDGELVAYILVHGSASEEIFVDGAVLPAVRRRGLGRRLLEWAEERAAGLHPGAPAAVRLDVHENNPGMQAMARAAGYAPTRWWHKMDRRLDDPLPDVPPTPPGLTLTPYSADRDEAVRHAHRDAFAGHWGFIPPDEQRWSQRYTGAQTFRPDVSWLVLDGDDVAAYLLTHFWEADVAATGVREAFVGQLGVRPPWRRRGLGGLLLAAALRSYRAAGYDTSALTVDTGNATGALGLYERAGYQVRDAAVTWMKSVG